MRVIEQVLEAEGTGHRQRIGFGEGLQVGASLGRPGAAAQQHDRVLRLRQHRAQRGDLRRRGRSLHWLVAAGVGYLGAGGQHVLGQRQHHRAGAAAGRHLEGAGKVFGDALGAVDLCHPLGHLAVHAAIVDFLECLAVDEVVADLADEQDHRRRILVGRVHADRGIGRARAAGDETDAGAAGELAIGFGHERGAAFLAVDDEPDRRIVQRVEHVEVAFARHAEGDVDAVDVERIDQDLAAGTGRKRHVASACMVSGVNAAT
jgi:hypothetical protein